MFLTKITKLFQRQKTVEKTEVKMEDLFADEQALVAVGWPPFLTKALNDSWPFVLCLRNGTVVHFEHASDCGNGWVHLDTDIKRILPFNIPPDPDKINYVVDGSIRGLEVRVEKILSGSQKRTARKDEDK